MNEFVGNYELSKNVPRFKQMNNQEGNWRKYQLFTNNLCAQMILQVNLFTQIMKGAQQNQLEEGRTLKKKCDAWD